MKKMLLFVALFGAFLITAIGQVTDSTAVVTYTLGQSLVEFLKSNMWTLAFAALYLISEWIGESDKIPEGSIWRKVLNWVLEFVKKKATISPKMKRTLRGGFPLRMLFMVLILSVFTLSSSAQGSGKWKYLARPLPGNMFKEQVIATPSGVRTLYKIAESNTVILYKLNGVINAGALTYNSETKALEPEAWVGAGPILSVRQYKADENGNAYERFGIGAGLLVGSGLTDIQLNQLKTVLNFEIGGTFSIGYGYAAITDTPNKRHSLLFNARFDF